MAFLPSKGKTMGYGKSKDPKAKLCGYCGRPGATVLSNPGARLEVFLHIKCRNESARKAAEVKPS